MKRGAKLKGKVKIEWSSEFAYAIGLLATDGCLSTDGRHINFTSKDRELVELFKKCLQIRNKIGKKSRIGGGERKYFQVQFGDVLFYRFLLMIGLSQKKSKILSQIDIPKGYFFDFLRGHFDGDGTFYSYWDPRWRSSYMFYTVFISASRDHIFWLRKTIRSFLGVGGHITKSINSSIYQLKYAKEESLKLLPRMYYNSHVVCLLRKRIKIKRALKVIRKKL